MAGHEVTIPPAGFGAYLALPEVTPAPAVVVFHEVWGLNDDIRGIVDRFAAAGYVALAPAICDGTTRCMMQGLRNLAAGAGPSVDAARASFAWIAGRDFVDSGRVAVAGFCMGGGFALLLASSGDPAAAAVNYGRVPTDQDYAAMCPIVASYGGLDKAFVPHVERLETGLTAAGIAHDVKVYPKAGHSFMNDASIAPLMRPFSALMHVGYKPDEAEEAWDRILAFFSEHV